jgi:potassium-dependent mechanosensitive channel
VTNLQLKNQITLGEYMSQQWQEISAIIDMLWQYKLFTIAEIDIRLGNILVAFTLLIFAGKLSRLVVKIINKKVILRFVDDKASQTTYQTFAFYAALALFVTLSLTVAGIPLTVFTVVGGALAIGVGFGSQNIVNNFISGVILLVEQPIKVGDVVDIDGMTGTIVAINTRSTKIKTIENKVYVVPNSFFLEKSVLNWTFEESVVRTHIDFGIAYGSDTRKVENLCMHILLNTEGVEQEPIPKVSFENFADSSLNFQLRFWCDLNKIDGLAEIRSRIRFELDQQFRDNKIEMAFPQRDMNVKLGRPIDIKILS